MAVGTCYAIGNEITGFVTTGTVGVVTNSSTVRTQFGSRCSLQCAPGTTADPPPNFFEFQNDWGPASSFYVLGVICWSALGGSADLNCVLWEARDASGVTRLAVRGAGSGAVKISTRDSAGTFVDLATSLANSMPLSGLAPFPMNIEVQYSSNALVGYVEVRLADNLVVSYTGANTTDGATQLANARFANCNASNGLFWSEEWVSSVTLLNAGVQSCPPVAPGASQAWSGNVSDIDGVVVNDTLFISDGNPGDLSGWTITTTQPSGAWQIQAIAQEARLAVGNTGPQHADFYLRTASTDHLFGDALAPPLNSFGNFSGIVWGENPQSSAPWTNGDFGAGINTGLKSLA